MTRPLRIGEELVSPLGRNQFLVASKSGPGHYVVEQDDETGEWACSCIAFNVKRDCRHVRAIVAWAEHPTKVGEDSDGNRD